MSKDPWTNKLVVRNPLRRSIQRRGLPTIPKKVKPPRPKGFSKKIPKGQ